MREKRVSAIRLRKALFAGALSLIMLVSAMITTAGATKTYQGNLNPEIAAAYTKVLESDLYQRLNVTPLGYPADNNSPDMVFTVCTLVDFEMDGQPELLAIYPANPDTWDPYSGDNIYYYEVWKWNGSQAICLAKQTLEGTSSFRLAQADGKIYLVNTVIGGLDEIYGIQNGTWKLVKSLLMALAVDDPCFVDGKEVSYSAYQNARNHWLSNEEEIADSTLDAVLQLYQQLSPRYAVPSSAKLRIDGKEYILDAYTIENANYYKLRDIAKLLVGTSKEASVEGSADGVRIGLSLDGDPGKYLALGTELTRGGTQAQIAYRHLMENYTASAIGRVVTHSYMFHNYNYFAIRDLGVLFDFHVEWDGDTQTVVVDTSRHAP